MVILIVGEFIFGLGDSLLIAAGVGNTPWTVLAEVLGLWQYWHHNMNCESYNDDIQDGSNSGGLLYWNP